MIVERRGFLKGALALFAAPAIIKATSLMPISSRALIVPATTNRLLTVSMITRESIQLFRSSNLFLMNLDRHEWCELSDVRIRLPDGYSAAQAA